MDNTIDSQPGLEPPPPPGALTAEGMHAVREQQKQLLIEGGVSPEIAAQRLADAYVSSMYLSEQVSILTTDIAAARKENEALRRDVDALLKAHRDLVSGLRLR